MRKFNGRLIRVITSKNRKINSLTNSTQSDRGMTIRPVGIDRQNSKLRDINLYFITNIGVFFPVSFKNFLLRTPDKTLNEKTENRTRKSNRRSTGRSRSRNRISVFKNSDFFSFKID